MNPTDGLKLYLPFNEEEGNVAYDLSGNSNHMSLYGGVTWELADNRYCVSCDGIDDYGRATNLNLLGENEIMTTAWVYVSSAQEVVGWKKSLTYGRTKPAPAYWCAMYIGSGQSATTISSFTMNVAFWHSGDNAGGSVGHGGLPVNRWVHIAWGFDKTLKIAKFYVDGVLVRTTDISSYIDGGYNTCLDESPSSGLHIGEGIGGERLVSKFAHIAVYNRLLDDEEVYKLYTSSSPIINTKTYQSDVLGNKDYAPIKKKLVYLMM